MEITWQASLSASCFHAAHALLAGWKLADESLARAMAEPSRLLAKEIEVAGLPLGRLLAQMVEYSAKIENNRQLVEQSVVKLLGADRVNPEVVGSVAGRVADLENAFRLAVPSVVDQLAVRGEPMRQQWDARGPGLLGRIGRLTEEGLIAPAGRVVLVYPALGGAGVAHLMTNTVTLEAVLTNPEPMLPEPLRLGWLLSQLNMEVPIYGELVEGARLPRLAKLSMLPATLAAAADVQWAALDKETLDRALATWGLCDKSDALGRERMVETLLDWWRTYSESSPRWAVALAALDRVLEQLPATLP